MFRVLLILVIITGMSCGQENVLPRFTSYELIRDLSYGDHERNKYDLRLPDSEVPTPLVIYFHGGGFVNGDKSNTIQIEGTIQHLLSKGIAFASVNYRYSSDNDQLGVGACMEDATYFLQFIRYYADKYNIDKSRVAVFGGSAGAGISLFLTYHDDMANPSSTNPILKESTKVSCAAAFETQATYDFFRWDDFIPGYNPELLSSTGSWKKTIANFYGYPNYRSFRPHEDDLLQKYDLLDMVSENDPPVWFRSKLSFESPASWNHLVHHPAHTLALINEMSDHGLNYYSTIAHDKTMEETIDLVDFFVLFLQR